jgi:hypothetical protein
MPVPIIIVAVAGAVGGAVVSEAIGGVFSGLTDKHFPTAVTVANESSEELSLMDRNTPLPTNVLGQTSGGAPSQWSTMPAEVIKPGQVGICSCYGSGLDAVAGAIRYRSASAPGFVLAWFAGGGVQPHYAIIADSARDLSGLWVEGQPLATKSGGLLPKKALSSNWTTGRSSKNYGGITIAADINEDIHAIDVRFTVTDVAAASASGSGRTASAATAEWTPTLTSSNVNGRNVAEVVAGASIEAPTAVFRETGPSTWTEFDASGTTARFEFAEVNRDDWSAYLVDASRGIEVQLDLHRKMVTFRVGTGARNDLYPIARSQAIAR